MTITNGAYTRTNLGQADGNNHARFFLESVQDQAASEVQGRPIFRDEERVEIIMPGNPNTRPVARVSDEHRQRWPREYEAFRLGMEISPDGTPLEEWSILKRSQVLELKALGFKTVEHIRDMDDLAIQRIGMGGRRLKEAANIFLDDAGRVALESKLSGDLDRANAEIAALRRQVEEMGQLTQRNFEELQGMKNAPSQLASNIPGMTDPVEIAKHGQSQAVAPSSLDNIGARARRGARAAAREAEA